MWYHLILSDITYNQDDITLKLDDIILRRGDITLNRGDITSKARWYHILLINSKTAPHTIRWQNAKVMSQTPQNLADFWSSASSVYDLYCILSSNWPDTGMRDSLIVQVSQNNPYLSKTKIQFIIHSLINGSETVNQLRQI